MEENREDGVMEGEDRIHHEEEEDEEEDRSDSASSEDEFGDVVFVTSSNHRQHEKRGVTRYNDSNSQNMEDDLDEDDIRLDEKDEEHDELSDLRFSYHRTAFDIAINELEEHEWRLPHADVSDYFNYGFNEQTWRSYCAKQLKHRASQGLGPGSIQQKNSSNSVVNILPQLAPPQPPPPPPPPPVPHSNSHPQPPAPNSIVPSSSSHPRPPLPPAPLPLQNQITGHMHPRGAEDNWTESKRSRY